MKLTKKEKILYAAIAFLSLIALGTSTALVYSLTQTERDPIESSTDQSADNETEEQDNSSDSIDEDDTTENSPTNESNYNNNDNTQFPEYTLSIGKDGKLTIPANWYISEITSTAQNLSQENMDTYNLQGVWPIHKGTQITLTNDDSEINFAQTPMQAFGPFGFTCMAVDIDKWEIVEDSTSTDEVGAARIKDGNRWIYKGIYKMDECMGQPTEYGFADVANINQFVFTGKDSDLNTATEIFLQAFAEDNFQLDGDIVKTNI